MSGVLDILNTYYSATGIPFYFFVFDVSAFLSGAFLRAKG